MKKVFQYGAAAFALSGASSLQAQVAQAPDVPSATPESDPVAANAAQAEANSGGIQDIVVTAQRRTETLQRAAIAASAVSGDALVSASITDPSQLSRLIPSLTIQPGVSSSIFIRGVGGRAINSFQENAVAFSVGGIFYGRPTAPAGTFYDLERIEVLKGPQGTLYGRNATGGAVNVIPRQPRLGDVSADLLLEYGNYDSKKVSAAINVPLGSIAALRVAGQVVDRDGYLSDGYSDEVGQAVRASLLIKPSSTFSTTLTADYFHQGGKGPGAVLFASPRTPTVPAPSKLIGAADPRIVSLLEATTIRTFGQIPPFSGLPRQQQIALVSNPKLDGFLRNDFWGVASTTNGDMGFADLTMILGYRKTKPDLLIYSGGFPSRLVEDTDQMTGEVRLTSKTDQALRYVLGAFYFYEDQHAFNGFNQGTLANTEYFPRLTTTSKAVFGQATLDVLNGFRLVGGGRYTSEEKTLGGAVRNTSLFAPNAPRVPISGDLTFNKFTWRAGFEWDVAERSLLYGTVATGFKAGGFYPSAGANTFKPEKILAYTLGSKNRFLSNRLQANIELFYWKYTNQQISYVGPVESSPGNFAQAGVTVNAGKARMYGTEADFLFQPNTRDTLGLTVQYLNARYNSLAFAQISPSGAPIITGCAVRPDPVRQANPPAKLFVVDCSGKPAVFSPKWAADVSYEHRFDLGSNKQLAVGGRSRIQTGYQLNIDFLEYQRQKGYTSSDLYVTLKIADRWSLTGFVNNVESTIIKTSGLNRALINVSMITIQPPRTYGARLNVKI